MTFWTNKDLEPKRSFRWIGIINFYSTSFLPTPFPGSDVVSTDGFGVRQARRDIEVPLNPLDIPPFLIKSFTKPNYSIPVNTSPDNLGTDKHFTLGVPTWSGVEVEIYDAVNPLANSTKIIYDFFKANKWDPSTDGSWSDAVQAIADADSGNIVNLTLQLINSEGKIFEQWNMIEPVLKEFNFGTLSYDEDGFTTIKLSFEIKGAKYTYIGE